MRVELEVRRLGPQTMLADVIAVIGRKDDDGLLGDAALVERSEDFAELRVEEADIGKIAVADLGGLLGRERNLVRGSAADFAAVVKSEFRSSCRPRGIQSRQLRPLVQVPILFRGVERRMRLPEADGQEERLSFYLAQHANGLGGHAAVVVGLIRHVAAFALRRSREIL